MTTITKDQVRKLTPEQQEAIGCAEIEHETSRQQLLERSRRGMNVWAGLFTGLTGGFAILCVPFPRLLPIAMAAVAALVTYHASRLYRRLDAMAELHDLDMKKVRDDNHEEAA